MDLSPIANLALSMAGMVVVPIAGIVAHRAIDLAQKKLHLQMSIETQRQVEAAIDAGAGVLRAKLANGHITLSDVSFGNSHVDQAAGYALDIAGTAAITANVTKDSVAKAIIGAVGHALGDDPGVQSVLVTPPQPGAPVAAAAVPELLPLASPPLAPVA